MNGMEHMNPDDRHAARSKQVDDVIAFGRTCAKSAFPNPARTGCPDRAQLRAMAQRDPRLALNDLPLTHVVHCSPCFQEYVRYRRISQFVHGLQISAASLIVGLVLAASVLFVKSRTSHRGEPHVAQLKQSQSEPSPSQANPQPTIVVPPLQLRIDLSAFSPTRGSEHEAPRKAIHLPRRNLRVTFEMPLGLEVGEYGFQLRDASGSLHSDSRAPGRASHGTISVDVDLDLAGASRGQATLMVRPPGLSWRSFPAIIE